jgi:transaldolase
VQILWPVYASSHGEDGFVSIEVSPDVALDTQRTIDSARYLHERFDRKRPFCLNETWLVIIGQSSCHLEGRGEHKILGLLPV